MIEQGIVITGDIGKQINEELRRSANVIASYYDTHQSSMPPNVACALTREMCRLRELADFVKPVTIEIQ